MKCTSLYPPTSTAARVRSITEGLFTGELIFA